MFLHQELAWWPYTFVSSKRYSVFNDLRRRLDDLIYNTEEKCDCQQSISILFHCLFMNSSYIRNNLIYYRRDLILSTPFFLTDKDVGETPKRQLRYTTLIYPTTSTHSPHKTEKRLSLIRDNRNLTYRNTNLCSQFPWFDGVTHCRSHGYLPPSASSLRVALGRMPTVH